MQCLNPFEKDGNTFNCGHCVNCRINRTSEWSLRLLYELSCHYEDGASFLTLTYNDENLPADKGLEKEELQKFFKRLRKNLQSKYHEFAPKILYYAIGEYGTKELIYKSPGAVKCHGRPHYHAIVFGLNNWNDEHREIVRKSWTLCEPWFFDKERGRKSGMQEVTTDDIQYVCGYVQKKLYGEMSVSVYGESTPPFSISSQGLGLKFAMQNKARLLNNGYTMFKGHKVSVPRYFCEKFGIKKGDLITDKVSVEKLKKENNYIFEKFKADMKKQNTWYPENETMMSHRFLLWYERKLWTFARDIEYEYQQRAKMRGKL